LQVEFGLTIDCFDDMQCSHGLNANLVDEVDQNISRPGAAGKKFIVFSARANAA
jgi:hypothetical protein